MVAPVHQQIPLRDDVPVTDVDPTLVHWLARQLLCYQYQSVHLVSPINPTCIKRDPTNQPIVQTLNQMGISPRFEFQWIEEVLIARCSNIFNKPFEEVKS